MAVADSLEEQGASSPGTISQWAGGLEGEVSGTLWREGSRYMATFLEPIPTLQELGHKVGSCLGLLDSVSLHDPAFLVQA